ncbi:hypothetical protein [Streptomyces cucumeris]|uniref:hypothetical protein n=1 Tax=Streptomyces cucumeris TaxID=2962890 RepID=UPI0020C87E3F|nr:hypothetical protein [Streptomyces sp. NEAU-Y11]MCP9211609.1 hypothetical protein [Streptomyces sp. NEAU-Y11]
MERLDRLGVASQRGPHRPACFGARVDIRQVPVSAGLVEEGADMGDAAVVSVQGIADAHQELA